MRVGERKIESKEFTFNACRERVGEQREKQTLNCAFISTKLKLPPCRNGLNCCWLTEVGNDDFPDCSRLLSMTIIMSLKLLLCLHCQSEYIRNHNARQARFRKILQLSGRRSYHALSIRMDQMLAYIYGSSTLDWALFVLTHQIINVGNALVEIQIQLTAWFTNWRLPAFILIVIIIVIVIIFIMILREGIARFAFGADSDGSTPRSPPWISFGGDHWSRCEYWINSGC